MRLTSLFFTAVLGVLCEACGMPSGVCDSRSCQGCCQAGQCVTAPSASACGSAGQQCSVCSAGQQCQLGACVSQTQTGGGSGAQGGGSASSGGGAGASGGGTALGGGTATGGGSATGGGTGISLPDAGSMPPAGFRLCGQGSVSNSAALTLCQTLNPASDLGYSVMLDCGRLQLNSARYESWCGPGEVYFWFSADSLSSTALSTCHHSFPLPDGGTVSFDDYRLLWDLSGTGGSPGAGYYRFNGQHGAALPAAQFSLRDPSTAETEWTGSWQVSTRVQAQGDGGTAALYLVAPEVTCQGIPTGAPMKILMAVPVTW